MRSITAPSRAEDDPVIVSELWRYPVKSLQGERLEETVVENDGFGFDRAFGIQDVSSGRVLSAKRWGTLLEGEGRIDDAGEPVIRLPHAELRGRSAETDTALSEWLDREVRLVAAKGAGSSFAESITDVEDDESPVRAFELPPDRFFDASHLLLITTASLRAAAALRPDSEWDRRRFRPNILLDVPGTGFVEDEWIGQVLRIGEVEIEVRKLCYRCALITRPQPGLERDLDVYRVLSASHEAALGVRCSIRTPGRLRIGDEARLDASSPAA